MFFVVALTAFFFLVFFLRKTKGKALPPGPMPIPILGNIVQIALTDTTPFVAFDKIGKKYGSDGLSTIYIGPQQIIFATSPQTVRDLLSKEECLTRSAMDEIRMRSGYKNMGIVGSEGKVWQEVRRFSLRTLREFGFNKRKTMEAVIMTEVLETLDFLVAKGTLEGSHEVFSIPTVNSLLNLVLGKRCDRADANSPLIRFVDVGCKFLKNSTLISSLHNFWPSLKYIAPKLIGYETAMELCNEMHEIARDILKEAKETRKTNSSSDCFVQEFLRKMEEEEKEVTDPKDRIFTDEQFVMVMTDFFQAGADTTSTTLSFAMLLLSYHPEVQQKLYDELLQVVGTDRTVGLEDRDNLPYVQSFMAETLRWSRLVPMVPRRAMTDFWYQGYHFKKDTVFMCNNHSVAMDKGLWGDPENFRVERFLTQDGLFNKSMIDISLGFGFGKRSCIGEALARDTLFLMLATIVQKLETTLVDYDHQRTIHPIMKMTTAPPPYTVSYKPRKQ